MIKQSKLSKICWALVYLFPLIYGFFQSIFLSVPDSDLLFELVDVFEELPIFGINFFSVPPFVDFIGGGGASYLDHYLGYLILVSFFRIIWRVLVYLPDVVGKLIDRWSL